MPSFSAWQSWSPVKPSFWRLPTWDYCPLPQSGHSTTHPINSKPRKKPINYWCSWYAFGSEIDEQLILQQAALAKKQLPVDTIIIDDGWTKWGDWDKASKHKFPQGIGALRKKLTAKNLKTGLWLAPFLAAKTSRLFQEHPEYFLRDQKNQLVNGFRSIPPLDRIFQAKYLLDFGQKAVQSYIFKNLDQMVENWGIKVLKLDFLYAPYFDPHFTSAKDASLQVKKLLSHIKKQHPQVFTIACGCPFDDARGLVDAIRISKDTSAPPPLPKFFRKILYRRRVKLLAAKATQTKLWRGSLADPDVQMFAFDNACTEATFAKLNSQESIGGFGDDLREISGI